MNGYLFALVQVVIYFIVVVVLGFIRDGLETFDVFFTITTGFVYFAGICQGVFYMSRKGSGKV